MPQRSAERAAPRPRRFRGLTVAAMLLVNNPGTWSASYAPLQHAKWHVWTPTDLIFPFFLFIVGITTQLSIATRRARGASDREIVRQKLMRGTLIILCGLLLSPFRSFRWSASLCCASPVSFSESGSAISLPRY